MCVKQCLLCKSRKKNTFLTVHDSCSYAIGPTGHIIITITSCSPCTITHTGTISILYRLLVLAIGILSQAAFSEAQEAVTIFLSSESGPPPLNVRECIEMFDNTYQARYICRDHQDMVPLLRYAESLAKAECEKQFEKELWNCSGFSLLRTPKINTGCKLHFMSQGVCDKRSTLSS